VRPSQIFLNPLLTFLFASLFVLSLATAAVGQATSQQAAATAAAPATPPQVPANPEKAITVYIQDFELDAADVTTDQSRIGNGPLHGNGPLRRATGTGKSSDPAAEAQNVVKLMSASLVEDFTKAGYTTKLLAPDDYRPTFGILITGVFTELDEGNRVRRAVIGFGSGAATMQLYVTATDLAHPEQALYQIDRNDSSGKKPGAVITMNPYVAAAKFVMEKGATDKTLKKTAKQVATDFDKRMQTSTATIATWPPAKSPSAQDPLNKYAKP
jgi:Domain of unknown function (DUF4410)